MKIWIVSVGEPLPIDGDNVRLRRMGNLATFVSNSDIDVEWFSVSFEHYQKKQRCNKDSDYIVNEHFTLHLAYVNGYKRNISLARIIHHKNAGKGIYKLMKSLEKPDVILASMEPLEVSSAAVQFANENGIPCIVDVRDLWPEIYYDVIPKALHGLLNIYVNHCSKTLKKTMSSCDSIIGLSNGFLNYGLKYAGRNRKETDAVFPIAYPNYDYASYRDYFDECWGKYGLNKDDFIVVFLGKFGDKFKFDEIVGASEKFIEYKDVKFVLCGNGKHQDEIREKTKENVIIPGWIEKKQILSLLSYAKIGIAPYIDSMNYRLNTPNKFGEYLSASLPIAVSVTGEMEALLNKHNCGAYYRNTEDLFNIIDKYYRDKDLQNDASKNARALFEKMFNGDNANAVLLQHIIEISKIRGEK